MQREIRLVHLCDKVGALELNTRNDWFEWWGGCYSSHARKMRPPTKAGESVHRAPGLVSIHDERVRHSACVEEHGNKNWVPRCIQFGVNPGRKTTHSLEESRGCRRGQSPRCHEVREGMFEASR